MRDDKLAKALETFIEQMRNRLEEKERDGFLGWDNPEWDSLNIPRRLFRLATNVLVEGSQTKPKDLIDIANLALILYHRRYQKAVEDDDTITLVVALVDRLGGKVSLEKDEVLKGRKRHIVVTPDLAKNRLTIESKEGPNRA